MNDFLDILLLASFTVGGVYSLWTAVQMRSWKELKPNKFIYPNGGTYLHFCPDEMIWAAFALGLGAVAVYFSAIRRASTKFW